MISRVTEFPGYLVRISSDSPTQASQAGPVNHFTEDAVIFFHGFPAHRGVKNLDLADYVHRKLNCDVYLLHYRGLGESPGVFKFSETLAEANRVIQLLTQVARHKRLQLVGHSWGGMVAANMAKLHPGLVDNLVLMSPFCDLKKADALYGWFVDGVRTELRHIFGEQSEVEISDDFELILQNHLLKNIAPQLSSNLPVSIIQAGRDDITPASALKPLLPLFSSKPHYLELDQDHSFTQNRVEVGDAIAQAISRVKR